MIARPLIIGSRASNLAQAQSRIAAQFLEQHGLPTDQSFQFQVTEGDKIIGPLWKHKEGKGLFVREIQQSLRSLDIDIATHSLKDVSIELPSDLCITAVIAGASPFDIVIFKDQLCAIDELPANPRIGTSSLRRALQLQRLRPDCQITPLRGNVETRLSKLYEGQLDAIVLASAGLERLDKLPSFYQVLTPNLMVPAFNQGLIGLECRSSDKELCQKLQAITSEACWQRYHWERTIAQLFGASCHSAIGVYVEIKLNQAPVVFVFAAQSKTKSRFFSQTCQSLPEAVSDISKFFELGKEDWSQCLFTFT